MGDRSGMSISADSPLDETLNRGPLALLLWRQYEFPFWINIVQFSISIFNFYISMISTSCNPENVSNIHQKYLSNVRCPFVMNMIVCMVICKKLNYVACHTSDQIGNLKSPEQSTHSTLAMLAMLASCLKNTPKWS